MIIRKLCFFICLLSLCYTASADSKKVSILTCSPGEQVYELFGHTALRVTDTEQNIDLVFNYGLFSFDEPNFVWRFVLGETDYLLGVTNFDTFMSVYAMRGSGVTEQILNLDSLQKQSIVDALTKNLKPQNRKYRYNFLFNNCTTKARDVVFEALLHDNIGYDVSSVGETMTFRDIVHKHTMNNPWYSFGMDLLLGASADVKAGRAGAQFAPLILKDELSHACINNGSMLVEEERELMTPQLKQFKHNNLTPFNVSVLFLFFTFVIMLCERRSKKTYLVWDILIMGLQGLAGCLLLFMVCFSQHPTVDTNWLLLCLNPLPLILLPILIYNVRKGKSLSFMWVQIAMLSLFLVLSPFLQQVFPNALYPCIVALIIRSLFHIYKNNICALD